ncbi:hypothetical protein WK68_14830 [Burkholderia ubonensis]|uniref:hypothetical protein n=1 Tax=Burkholderia ubonensis TaxID=101571 RepID=UPI00075C9E2E|nr:hypothetical protein [Burkholderia ubonensis]KVU38856.1 hypothetical protein WK68_14830 [Burkholderia ubonensis]
MINSVVELVVVSGPQVFQHLRAALVYAADFDRKAITHKQRDGPTSAHKRVTTLVQMRVKLASVMCVFINIGHPASASASIDA